MGREGKPAESRAVTWSTGRVVIRYDAVIVLTSPTRGNAATTVPPCRSTSLNVRTSTSAMRAPHTRRGLRTKYVCGTGGAPVHRARLLEGAPAGGHEFRHGDREDGPRSRDFEEGGRRSAGLPPNPSLARFAVIYFPPHNFINRDPSRGRGPRHVRRAA